MNFTGEIEKKRASWLWRGFLFITALLSTGSVIQFRSAAIASGYVNISDKWRLGISLLFILPGFAWLLTALSLTRINNIFLKILAALEKMIGQLGRASWLLFLACLIAFCYIMIWPVPLLTGGFFIHLFLLWLFCLAGFTFLRILFPGIDWRYLSLASLLIFVTGFCIALYLPGITNYPFSLSWSEANIYFYSSLFLSPKFYGTATSLPVYSPARALLGVLPLLLPEPQIWLGRLWTAFLWVVCTGLTAFLVARRLRFQKRSASFLFILWASLFILQGPIFYELLLAVVLVAWLFNAYRFWSTLLVVFAASAWAGICRVNWFPVPGAFAVLLYLLETPQQGKNLFRYLMKPAAWMLFGLSAAVAVYFIYGAIAGNPATYTSIALQSRLLWNRLFPNPISPLGVLPEAILVSMPAALVVTMWQVKLGFGFTIWRRLGVAAILAIFFAGGLVVSAKIGGGAGIHNLDAYWFFLLVVVSYLYFNRSPGDLPVENPPLRFPALLSAALIAVPTLYALTAHSPSPPPGPGIVAETMAEVQKYVTSAMQKGEEVLFIDNKQLLTYGYFPAQTIEPQYETGYMLDMAMSENRPFFQKFYQELKDHHYGVIITYPQPKLLQDPTVPMAEENNTQLTWIGFPLLCYYQEAYIRLDVNIDVFIPRDQPGDCP
jgi:hypothetical protein